MGVHLKFDQIAFQIDHSPTLRLLRSDYASLALSFFQFAFKTNNRLQIPYSTLKELLERFLVHLDDAARREFSFPAQHYLDLWCDDQHRFLRKYYEMNHDEPMTELTYDAERALEWLHGLEKREFVGTQSRFLSIFENMKRIVDQTEDDPASRLAYLKIQRKQLDEEIKRIQTTGVLDRMDSTQIRERFLNLLEDSRRLLSEFRLVEDIFKELTRNIKEQKLKESVTKGDILRQVLDAHDFLEESDQGKSFSSFWNFLVSDESQNLLRELSERVLQTPEIQAFVAQNSERQMDGALRKLKGQLLQMGQKVLRSKFRLSEELRKLLHQRTLADNKVILAQILQIKKLMVENRDVFLGRSFTKCVYLDHHVDVRMPLLRPLWQPNREARFALKNLQVPVVQGESLNEELTEMLRMDAFSEERLAERIQEVLEGCQQASFSEVVKRFPIRYGAAEVVGYLSIAIKSDRHHVHLDQQETIPVTYDGISSSRPGTVLGIVSGPMPETMNVPQIIFTRGVESHGAKMYQ